MSKWHFREMRPSEQNRAPTEDEFFRPEDPIAALVREAIQNSMDATVGGPVHVRFTIANGAASLSASRALRWADGLDLHLVAPGVELSPISGRPMPFIAIEDFGTHGLLGNTRAARRTELADPESTEDEDFFYFWRNVGKTGKTGAKRGSWGLGKAVYASASTARMMFGWTVRSNDSGSLLMGQAVLDMHDLGRDGDVRHCDAYGFYAKFGDRADDPDFACPIDDEETIQAFRRDFELSRGGDSGLSIVVPFPSDDFQAATTVERFAWTVVDQFAYPVLAGSLSVEVRSESKIIALTRDSIRAVVGGLALTDNERNGLLRQLELTEWLIASGDPEITLQRVDSMKADWDEISILDDDLDRLRSLFSARQPLLLRVPVLVRKKEQGGRVLSHFDVALQQHDDGAESRYDFIRQGLRISEIDGPRGSNIAMIVRVDDEHLALLLRDAENPSHTKWLTTSRKLKGNYVGAADRVKFVVQTPRAILKRLLDTAEESDHELLADLFPDPDPDGATPAPGPGGKGPKPPPPPPPPPPPRPKALRLSQIAGGFSVTRVSDVRLPSRRFVIRAAFDVVNGNPFKAYEPFDFALDDKRFIVTVECGSVVRRLQNEIEFEIEGDEFKAAVKGFPDDRDLAVTYTWRSGSDE